MLKETYDNQTIIIKTHIDELLQFPTIEKENKADTLKKIIWHINTHLKSLEALKQPVKQWETIIIHLAKKKLDYVEQRDWQNAVKNRTPEDMPTIEEFLKFLNERCQSLKILNKGKLKYADEKSQSKKSNRKVALTAVFTVTCKVCGGNYLTFQCKTLIKKTIEERTTLVKEKRLCLNCLNLGHIAKECKSSPCRKCMKKHHTLLHREQAPSTSENATESTVVSCCMENSKGERESPHASFKSDSAERVFYVERPAARVILSTARVYVYDKDGNKHMPPHA